MSRISVLSLDGGGTFAAVMALALGRVYGPSTPGRGILRQFDLVAANSGGSIVVAALLANYSPDDVAGFYADPATVREMYSPRWSYFLKDTILRPLFPPYSSAGKRAALAKLLDAHRGAGEPAPSTVRLVDWPSVLGTGPALLITAYDYDTERAAFFRSTARAGDVQAQGRSSVPLIDAVHASTQLPILYYAQPAVVSDHRRYWDGGLAGYNNPVLAAVTEAMAEHPGRADDLHVLSIGAGAVMPAPDGQGAPEPLGRTTGTSRWTQVKKAAGAALADPPFAATFHAYMALHPGQPPMAIAGSRLVRLSPLVRPRRDATGSWQPPRGLTVQQFEALLNMKPDTTSKPDLELIRRMSELWFAGSVENEPVLLGSDPSADLGDIGFGAALDRWRAGSGHRELPVADIA